MSDGGRLAALYDLAILDTAPEEDFDRFTRLAAELLDAPVSLVSLIDRDRNCQFFKSQHGLPEPWASARQSPLSHSLCQHVVSSGRALVIEDGRCSAIVAASSATRDLSSIAYAGVPLILGDGRAVGALCAVAMRPRRWSERDLRILADLAAAVQALVDVRYATAQRQLHDRLTGLPFRALTVASAERIASRQTSGELVAVTVDISDLGAVNEVYGTVQGDRIVRLVARRIAHELRPDDVLGRLDGDVFVVIRSGVDDQLQALALAHRIREGVAAQAVRVRSDQLQVNVAVGIACGVMAEGAGDADQLITRAAEVMRIAKGQRGRVMVDDADRAVGSATRLRTRGALRGAVVRGEVTVAFQPIVELATGTTRGFEALARWEHPELGRVAPTEFIPVAEATGEIVVMGEHVLRTACAQMAQWRSESSQDLQIAVNLSPLQLAVPTFAEILHGILVTHHLPGPSLVLEITEGVFMTPEPVARRNLDQLRELGVRIALDDFGTGYSALSYLERFPVDVIKADRSFLAGLGDGRRDLAVLRAILAIGDAMDIQVVAEGIETQRQLELLRLLQCPLGQGFLFATPLAAEEIIIGRRSQHPAARRRLPEARLAASPMD